MVCVSATGVVGYSCCLSFSAGYHAVEASLHAGKLWNCEIVPLSLRICEAGPYEVGGGRGKCRAGHFLFCPFSYHRTNAYPTRIKEIPTPNTERLSINRTVQASEGNAQMQPLRYQGELLTPIFPVQRNRMPR